MEQNSCISSMPWLASDSVSLPRLDNPTGACPTHRRQWADFLVSLMAPLHRQYKTARTETRRHLLLKIRQMPTQISASRGYVLFRGAIRDTHKSPKIVCWLADTVRGVLQTWKDTEWDASRGMEEILEFCFKEFAAVCLFWNFFVLWSSNNITYHSKARYAHCGSSIL